MKSIQVKIIDPIGLHARPASKITSEATKYKSDIKIVLDGREANAKSLINLMALGVKSNNKVELIAKGLDEANAIVAIEKVMRDNKLI
ncbi:MAG: HPr family phosphocarrier protein [Mycoplasmataceae bacterium]|jgi:phosphocarrier protein|nr:HPr family phosphocarrier protein [Mycoplasmataceae bacterium]